MDKTQWHASSSTVRPSVELRRGNRYGDCTMQYALSQDAVDAKGGTTLGRRGRHGCRGRHRAYRCQEQPTLFALHVRNTSRRTQRLSAPQRAARRVRRPRAPNGRAICRRHGRRHSGIGPATTAWWWSTRPANSEASGLCARGQKHLKKDPEIVSAATRTF